MRERALVAEGPDAGPISYKQGRDHRARFTIVLARATSMPVQEVTNNLGIEPNHVYVIPPNVNMTVAEGVGQSR